MWQSPVRGNAWSHKPLAVSPAKTEWYDERLHGQQFRPTFGTSHEEASSEMRNGFTSPSFVVVMLVLATLALESRGLDKQTVGLWSFESGVGDKVVDASGNGFDGTLVGEPDWTRDGKFGGALVFDGLSRYVEIPAQDAFDLAEFTVELWFWAESVAGTSAVFGHGESFDSDKAQYVIEINDDANPNRVQLWYEAADDSDTYVGSTTDVTTQRWYFFAASRDETGDIRIYIDGELETEHNEPMPPASIDHVITIGCRTNSPDVYQDFFHGRIDEVRISDVARDENEIRDAFENGFLAVTPQEKLTVTWATIKQL